MGHEPREGADAHDCRVDKKVKRHSELPTHPNPLAHWRAVVPVLADSRQDLVTCECRFLAVAKPMFREAKSLRVVCSLSSTYACGGRAS